MSEETTETVSSGIEGRSGLPCELASTLAAARAIVSTPVVTRSSDVHRLETTTSMVFMSQVYGVAEVSPRFRK